MDGWMDSFIYLCVHYFNLLQYSNFQWRFHLKIAVLYFIKTPTNFFFHLIINKFPIILINKALHGLCIQSIQF